MKITWSLNKNLVLKQLKRKIYLNQRDREFCAAREHFWNFSKADLWSWVEKQLPYYRGKKKVLHATLKRAFDSLYSPCME